MKMMKLPILTALCLVGINTAVAAGGESITWAKNVAPIFQERCLECHRPGEIGPMSLLSFEDARPWAKAIKEQVASKKMPPYPADPASMPFQGDMNLEQWEIDTIVGWVDQGARFGNAADLPEPKNFNTFEGGWKLGNPDLILTQPEPFTVGADVSDLYQCFVVPVGFEHEVWTKGIEFMPGNRAVAHHFILFEDLMNEGPARDAATPEVGFECGNMQDLLSMRILKMWAPGNVQPLTPEGVGNILAPGKNLILQSHFYNSTGTEQVDQSSIGFFFVPPGEVISKKMRGRMVVQPNLNIPAGDPDARHEARVKTLKDITIYDSGVHMHLRGKSIGQWAKLPGSEEEITMVWVPQYDFNWQFTYPFVEPFKAPKGTEFIMRSVHDNSANNPNNPDPTVDVSWGNYSGDEMAFTGYSFTLDDEQLNLTPKPLSEAELARLRAQ
jgi:hypothetical protein